MEDARVLLNMQQCVGDNIAMNISYGTDIKNSTEIILVESCDWFTSILLVLYW